MLVALLCTHEVYSPGYIVHRLATAVRLRIQQKYIGPVLVLDVPGSFFPVQHWGYSGDGHTALSPGQAPYERTKEDVTVSECCFLL